MGFFENQFNQKDKDKKNNKERKKRLVNQMKMKQRMIVKNIVPEKVDKTSTSKQNNSYIKMQKKVDNLQNDLKKADSDVNSERKKSKELKRTHKNELKKYEKEVNSLKKQNKLLQKQFDKKIKGTSKILSTLKSAGWEEGSSMDELLEDLTLKNEALQNENERMLRLDRKSIRGGNDQASTSKEKWKKNKNKELKSLKREIFHLEQKVINYDKLKADHNKLLSQTSKFNDPQFVIHKLEDMLDSENLDQFKAINQLFEKYNNQFQKSIDNSEEGYGYLKIEEDQLIFVNVNKDQQMELTIPDTFKRYDLITDGLAIQVKVKDDFAVLNYCFPAIELNQADVKQYHKKKRSKEINESMLISNPYTLKWAKQQKIVVIGNKHVDAFVNVLNKYVAEVTQIDAYEESPEYVTNHIISADYAFVLTDSVPHSVMENIKKEKFPYLKVQFFYLPSKNDGAVRLNYIFWNQSDMKNN